MAGIERSRWDSNNDISEHSVAPCMFNFYTVEHITIQNNSNELELSVKDWFTNEKGNYVAQRIFFKE